MNKQTKGAIAAGAAALLLAGGAGTMAAWNASENVAGGAINSGKLTLTQEGSTGWTVNGQAVADIASYLAVPGDEIVYNAAFKIGAAGDNLEAVLDVDEGSISGDLAAALDPAVAVTLNGAPLAGGVVTDANDGQVVQAQVTFNFDATGTDFQNVDADLSEFTVTLTQQ
ncbi:alternate-type signal peptide domain-containing protein [Rhodococcus gannanensis]|uniref:Alternate-type signal peptide domain-containing protein n=1 Tax=Rhodococcus gannanensis TaxID=1960308 RepID=A0ABW4P950_9NOCA